MYIHITNFYHSGLWICEYNWRRFVEEILTNVGTQTWATLVTFFLMMTLNQDVQKKAQDAIDSIIGSDRLPTIDDRARLPYIDCILKEIFRCVKCYQVWSKILMFSKNQSSLRSRWVSYTGPGCSQIVLTMAHAGLTHTTLEPEQYGEWVIPKGALVSPNVWYVSTPMSSTQLDLNLYSQANDEGRGILQRPPSFFSW